MIQMETMCEFFFRRVKQPTQLRKCKRMTNKAYTHFVLGRKTNEFWYSISYECVCEFFPLLFMIVLLLLMLMLVLNELKPEGEKP